MDDILNDIDTSVLQMINGMKLAKIYNAMTGANVSHWDMEELGILEESRILAAVELWDL